MFCNNFIYDKRSVRFVFTPICLLEGSCLIVFLCMFMHSGVQHFAVSRRFSFLCCVVFFSLFFVLFLFFVFFLCLVYPLVPVSLDCPLLIAPSVFVYFCIFISHLELKQNGATIFQCVHKPSIYSIICIRIYTSYCQSDAHHKYINIFNHKPLLVQGHLS